MYMCGIAKGRGQCTLIALEDVIKTVDNVGGDYSEGSDSVILFLDTVCS